MKRLWYSLHGFVELLLIVDCFVHLEDCKPLNLQVLKCKNSKILIYLETHD